MSQNAINEKAVVINEIKEKINKSKSVIIVDYRGLTVSEATVLRNQFRAAGVEYKVFKNKMVSRAAEELGIKGLDKYLEGPSAFVFGYNDPVMPAKRIISEFINKAKKTEVKGGIMNNAVIDNSVVKKLAELPTKDVLITKFMWSIQGSIRNLAYAFNAVKEKMQA